MARIEFPEELQKKINDVGAIDLLVGVTGPAEPDELRVRAACLQGLAPRIVVAYAGVSEARSSAPGDQAIQLAAYPMPPPRQLSRILIGYSRGAAQCACLGRCLESICMFGGPQ